MYLLEKASIFILLAPTCYIQIAGQKLYLFEAYLFYLIAQTVGLGWKARSCLHVFYVFEVLYGEKHGLLPCLMLELGIKSGS